ncbi:MAG: hypothetical protein AVDCRST_MAG88-1722, partial [uncultured Thermomicrobiales bacterium]
VLRAGGLQGGRPRPGHRGAAEQRDNRSCPRTSRCRRTVAGGQQDIGRRSLVAL